MVLGAVGAMPCYAMIVWRPRTRVDETLDVLAAHGIAGFTGILFIGFFASVAWNGVSDGLFFGNASQLGDQALAALVTPLYAFGMTYVLLRAMGAVHLAARERARGGDRAWTSSSTARRPTPAARERSWSCPPPTGSGARRRPRLGVVAAYHPARVSETVRRPGRRGVRGSVARRGSPGRPARLLGDQRKHVLLGDSSLVEAASFAPPFTLTTNGIAEIDSRPWPGYARSR